MANHRDTRQSIRKILNVLIIPAIVLAVCGIIFVIGYLLQIQVERGALPPMNVTGPKDQYEIAKLAAEIRQIRSDTSGSLFWLKMAAVFVTVGGAVGGYLVGQSRITTRRIDFENRKNVDTVYQAIVQELSNKEAPVLRAAAAVKLGNILKSFPKEWMGDDPEDLDNKQRRNQLIQLTKKILAASLAIEKDEKVLKTLTIALVLHHKGGTNANARQMDLSLAVANDAFWKAVDFSGSDFYKASLKNASFRKSMLRNAQFRETNLDHSVFIEADCTGANFKMADLRDADLSDAILRDAKFAGSKVHGCKLGGATIGGNNVLEDTVDDSKDGNEAKMITVRDWFIREGVLKISS